MSRILIVDDDPDIIKAIRVVLETNSYDCMSSKSSDSFRISSKLRFLTVHSHPTIRHTPAATASVWRRLLSLIVLLVSLSRFARTFSALPWYMSAGVTLPNDS